MNIYKNSEVSKKFSVSPSTVTLWIKNAVEGKNKLELFLVKNKHHIIKTQQNDNLIEKLKDNGGKYKPSTSLTKLNVDRKFFEIFSKSQIIDIIRSIKNFNEIPHKYTFYYKGQEQWSKYIERSYKEGLKNTLTNTKQILEFISEYVVSLAGRGKLNLIDLGGYDFYSVQPLLQALNNRSQLHELTAVNINQQISEMFLKQSVEYFSNNELKINNLKLDISKHSFFDQIQLSNYTTNRAVNLICCIRSVIENQLDKKEILLNIKNSISPEDIVLLGFSLEKKDSITNFDLWESSQVVSQTPDQEKWILDLMGINSNLYHAEMMYNSLDKTRLLKVVFERDVEVVFKNGDIDTKIFLEKGKSLNIWRHSHNKLKNILSCVEECGFNVLSATSSLDKTQVILTCQLAAV